MRYIEVVDGTVVRIHIVADAEDSSEPTRGVAFLADLYGIDAANLMTHDHAGVGWIAQGAEFVMPPAESVS